jgi:DNA-binding MarR family transcriptional regulator
VKAKLTAEAVRIIRDEYRAGNATQKELAARFNTTQATISRAIRGDLWRHVSTEVVTR